MAVAVVQDKRKDFWRDPVDGGESVLGGVGHMEYFQRVRPKRVDLKRRRVSHRAITGRRSWVYFTSFWFMVVVVLQFRSNGT